MRCSDTGAFVCEFTLLLDFETFELLSRGRSLTVLSTLPGYESSSEEFSPNFSPKPLSSVTDTNWGEK
jgi:hypothetical protein